VACADGRGDDARASGTVDCVGRDARPKRGRRTNLARRPFLLAYTGLRTDRCSDVEDVGADCLEQGLDQAARQPVRTFRVLFGFPLEVRREVRREVPADVSSAV